MNLEAYCQEILATVRYLPSPHASRNSLFTTNRPAELAACRSRKAGFNAAQGDFGNAPQLYPRCPVGSLNAKACHHRRQVTSKVSRPDLCREFAFRLRLLQALLQ